ncbi:MAG TPA: GNAT family N-acetyltransferase [Frankiaceae bacterium]|jgi:predicted GNAT family N-acyltransferase|nr:GNAT family N-acetyltransferase [Frankiaceae bacterium]
MSDGVRARITADPAVLAEASKLRHRVFVLEQGVDAELEFDGRDGDATHVVLEDAGTLIGTARIFDTGSEAVVGRVAVEADRRGQGLGVIVMAAAERWAGDAGLPTVELHAQQAVVGFYERLGYKGVGEPYEEAGIPHQTMRKQLLPGLRPVTDADSAGLIELIGGVWADYPSIVLDIDGEEPWLRAPAAAYPSDGSRGELWVVPLPDADGLLACAGWRPHAGGVELKSLYVAAKSRRQGWGSRLVHFVERRAGCQFSRERVKAWSDSRFTDSHQLYARLGYRWTGATRDLHDKSATVELEFVGTPEGGGAS